MESRIFPAGTTAHCNRCDSAFTLPKDREGIRSSDIAWRLQQFCTCPHCEMTDCHWVYDRDLPQPEPFPMVDTGEDCPQFTFLPAPEQQLSLL